jgi:hypothetical protein
MFDSPIGGKKAENQKEFTVGTKKRKFVKNLNA